MSLVKCQEYECGDIIESTDEKACIRHARHHGKSYKEINWELVIEEVYYPIPKDKTGHCDTTDQ